MIGDQLPNDPKPTHRLGQQQGRVAQVSLSRPGIPTTDN